jgi:RHS repeat-associated protein
MRGGAASVRAPAQSRADSPEAEKPGRTGDLLPSVTLPKGGGAIRGLGEKFSVNAANGTAAMSLPLPLSPGRSGFTPALQLSYDSGAGNGVFGFGWTLGAPAITRKTDKGLPRYCDSDESDVFLLSGAEDLVPVLDATGARKSLSRTVFGTSYRVHFYRPRLEGLFARIERWVATDTGITHWRSLSRDNVTTLYGCDALSRVADPADPTNIFSWHICRSWDDKGNLAVYGYVREDGAGIDRAQAHEANRTPAVRAAQTYLRTIQYGNLEPYFPDWTAATETALPSHWMFSVVLDYGDHAGSPPQPQPDRPWPVRPDPLSSNRAGFEVRTYRRAHRLLFFNNFPEEPTAGPDCLVRSLDLVYSDQQAPADPRHPLYSFLVSATQTGYRKEGAATIVRSLPPLEFSYSRPHIQPDVLSLDRDSLGNLPEGIDGSRFRWVDLDGEGLSGILSEAPAGWYYKRNLSANNIVGGADKRVLARASFGPLRPVAEIPAGADLAAGQQLLALSGDGRLDLVALADPDPGFYRRSEDSTWEPLERFASLPQLDWREPNLRFIDLTGDGLADILITEDGLFSFHASLGEAGFDLAQFVRTPWDEEKGPKVVFADGTDTIFVADMTGDGLSDIARVRNGEVCYWPNVGYGRFGAKVTMDRAPRFDSEDQFDPRRIRLADIDGTGSADLLYIGADGVHAWFNQSGNAWSAENPIAVFPTADNLSAVQVFDLLGTGTACLVWSSPLPAQAAAPLLYVDLMGGEKPHLMVMTCNNLGAETRVTYAPSTRFYIADEAAGRPWLTHLPFPVQVVERSETIDWIGRNRLVTRYAYHHGYYDGYEREFRGFGMVERWDTEEFRADTEFAEGWFVNWNAASFTRPILTRTWFHTGVFLDAQSVSNHFIDDYWTEPALRTAGRRRDAAAMRIPDTVLPTDLDAYETQEAYRALKGQALRVEVYADDGASGLGNPYTVTEANFTILCLQHRGLNRHGVFFAHPREPVSFHYERADGDPRVTHDVILETDAYGNVTRAVSIGYPRRGGHAAPEPTLSASFQAMLAYDQTRLHLRATETQYTNAIDDPATLPDRYRTPLPAAGNIAEITGVMPSVKGNGITSLFSFEEVDGIWNTAWSGAHDIPYEAVPASDIDGGGAPAGALTRRLIAQSRILYRSDDLSSLLPLGTLESRALSGQSYKAALTSGLLSGIFGALVSPATLTEGGYVQLVGETGWWIPSGRVCLSPGDGDTPAQELANARTQFFLPRRAVDPFGAISRVAYDNYSLLVTSTTDPVANVTAVANDYRVLGPTLITDPNGNRAAVAFDALGVVTATAVMGKTTEKLGDLLTGFTIDLDDAAIAAQFADPLAGPAALLGNATTRILYDFHAYRRASDNAQPSPPAIYTLARETHVADLAARGGATQYQYGFAYSDGFGREIQRKARVAPGPVSDTGPDVAPRWLGSGWTIFNNKGQPVRRYEPFFSATNAFEFAAQHGMSTVLFYDPPGRVVATLHPNNSWEKIVFDAWRQESWDGNDTVLIADPRQDADVGAYFARLLGEDPAAFTPWYKLRIRDTFGVTTDDQAAQKDAALKAAAHAATPTVTHLDALGRSCLVVSDNGGGNRFPARTAYDTEGNPLAVFDALGRRAQEYVYRAPQSGGGFRYVAGLDMAGNTLYRINADGGARRGLNNVVGNPIRSWDARGHAFRLVYDAAQRPTHRCVSTDGGPEILIEFTIYGEGQATANLCGRAFRHYDQTGYAENSQYDFKGNLLSSVRQLAAAYRQAVDWSPLAGITNAARLDTAASAAGLIPSGDGGRDRFARSTFYDAINRPIQAVTPHNATMKPNALRHGYDAGGQLVTVDAWLQQAVAPTALVDPKTADRRAVTAITYNARGQRLSTAYGNGTVTAYDYDARTFRLANLTTTRPASFPVGRSTVQALAYFYDPIGNITRIRDTADTQNVIYFRNLRVEPSTDYTYDPLYRLISATGREHLGQTGGALRAPQQLTNNDSFRMILPLPGDGNAMGRYTETYTYDPVGNILATAHQALTLQHIGIGSWTRRCAYAEASQIVAGETGNRLSATSLPGDPAAGPYSATYAHDVHGNMTRMPHLPVMSWDEDDRLRSTARQVLDAGTPRTTFYVYDAGGQRMRKLTERPAAALQTATRQAERIYLGGNEIFREYAPDGTTVTLERETLHIDAGDHPIAFVETRTAGTDSAPAQLVRYQFGNHLGSAVLELDDQSGIVSYEEYFPFGSTSYQAAASQNELPKRYRSTEKERDEENDLYYHSARYYAPWLGRWTGCDPKGAVDGFNLFIYTFNNPIRFIDPSGTGTTTPAQKRGSGKKVLAEVLTPEEQRAVRAVVPPSQTAPPPILPRFSRLPQTEHIDPRDPKNEGDPSNVWKPTPQTQLIVHGEPGKPSQQGDAGKVGDMIKDNRLSGKAVDDLQKAAAENALRDIKKLSLGDAAVAITVGVAVVGGAAAGAAATTPKGRADVPFAGGASFHLQLNDKVALSVQYSAASPPPRPTVQPGPVMPGSAPPQSSRSSPAAPSAQDKPAPPGPSTPLGEPLPLSASAFVLSLEFKF